MKLNFMPVILALTLAVPLLMAPAKADEASTQAYMDAHKK